MRFKGIIPEVKLSEVDPTAFTVDVLSTISDKLKPYPIIAVNTSGLFNGTLGILKYIRDKHPKKFIIRKDFIMIPRQIEESKQAGADAVLIIREMLHENQYNILIEACKKYKITPIVEAGIRTSGSNIIMFNSRNLNTSTFDKALAERRCKAFKAAHYNVIYASGENSDRVIKAGIADAVLIGTAFMRDELK